MSFIGQINKRFDDLTTRLYSLERDDISVAAVTHTSSDSSSGGVATNAQSIVALQSLVGRLQQQMGGLTTQLQDFQTITDVTAVQSVVESKEDVNTHMNQTVFQF
jgi:hypothetical protein